MTNRSSISDQTTLSASHTLTGSQVSADGLTVSNLPAGLTTDLFGQVLAPVSRGHERTQCGSAEKPVKTIDTYGLSGAISSTVADLQSSLANRLRKQLPLDGWTKSLTIWSEMTTPAGRQLSRLSVSARHRNASDYGLYATPTKSDTKGSVSHKRSMERLEVSKRGVRLPEQLIRIAGKDGQPNPAFICSLMGYPAEWEDSACTVTPSSRKSQRNSSVPMDLFGNPLTGTSRKRTNRNP